MTEPCTKATPAAVDLFGDYAKVTTANLSDTGAPAVVLTVFNGEGDDRGDVNLVLAPGEALKLARDLEDAADDLTPAALLAYRHAAALSEHARTIHLAGVDTEIVLDAYRRAAEVTKAARDLDAETT